MTRLVAEIGSNQRLRSIFLGIFVALTSLGIGLTVASGLAINLLVPVVAGLFLLVIVISKPRLGVSLVILLVLFQDWLVYGVRLLPNRFIYISDILILAIWISTILWRRKNRLPLVKTPVDYLIAGLLLAALFSAVANSLSLVEVFFGFRLYFKFLLLFYAVVNLDLDESAMRGFVLLFVIASAVSIPIVFINYSIWGANDYTGGGIGAKSAHSLLFNITLIVMLSTWLIRRGLKIHWLLIAGGLMLPWLLGSVIAAFFYFPLVFLFISRRLFNYRSLVVLPVLVVLYVAGVMLYPKLLPANALQRTLFSPQAALEELQGPNISGGAYGEAGLRRIPAIQFANTLVQDNPLHFLFGFGPGTFTGTQSSLDTNSLYRQYSRESLARQQLSQTIAELGYAGLGLMLLIIFRLFFVNYLLLRRGGDEFWYGVFVSFEAAALLFVILMPYQSTWISNVSSVLFWMLAALVSKKWLEMKAVNG